MNTGMMRWLAAGMVLTGVGGASGQTAAENEWDFRVTPYFWAIATEGDVGVGEVTVPVDMSFSEAWDRLDFGGMLSLEANKDQWIVFLDGTFIRIEDKKTTQLGVVEAEVEQSILQAAVGYNVVENSTLSLDLGVGGRYLYTDYQGGDVSYDISTHGYMAGLQIDF